ncbi:MAG TPA: hypothetical protein VFX44_04055 [Solirubrobacterales bacterium]|nr:hypothetical protein [Solirubrobacterales bacterium]
MAVMMTPRETWTDQRLDDLNKKVDDGFARLERDIRELRGEINDLWRQTGKSCSRRAPLTRLGGR